MSSCDLKLASPVPKKRPAGEGCCDPNKFDSLFWGGLFITVIALIWKRLPSQGITALDRVMSSISHTTREMLGGVIVGILIVGVLETIPKEVVGGILGSRRGWRGILRAMFAGLALDLCNHGILLIGMSLYRRGASLGQLFAFLIASPWNSFSVTILLSSLIGLPWTLLFLGGSGVIALISGMIVEKAVDVGFFPKNSFQNELLEKTDWSEVWYGLRRLDYTLMGILTMIWKGMKASKMLFRWLFLGTILAALIQVFVPADWYQHWFGPTMIGLLMTFVAATVIEVCSEGSLPIAGDLFLRAHAPGNAFAFLMAGASTDMTEIVALRQTTGSWKIAFLMPLVTVPQILLLSWVMNR